MKKYMISLMLIITLISILTSVTYAWFTYVERKSLATFEAGDITITTQINDTLVVNEFNLGTLAYFDYEKDLVSDQYQVFNHMVTRVTVHIKNGSKSPLTKHQLEILDTDNPEGMLYFIIYEGLNVEASLMTIDYYQVFSSLMSGSQSYEALKTEIDTYNQNVLEIMGQTTTTNDDTLVFQIICFGVYDIVSSQENYLNQVYSLSLIINTINAKGQVV